MEMSRAHKKETKHKNNHKKKPLNKIIFAASFTAQRPQ
jgi:hypothetical protein